MELGKTPRIRWFGADIFVPRVSHLSSRCHLYKAHVVHMGFLFTLSGGAGLFPVISAPSLQYPGKRMSFCRKSSNQSSNQSIQTMFPSHCFCAFLLHKHCFSSPFCFLWLLLGFAQFPPVLEAVLPTELGKHSSSSLGQSSREPREVLAARLSPAWAHFVTHFVQDHRVSQGLFPCEEMKCPCVSQGDRNASIGKCFTLQA